MMKCIPITLLFFLSVVSSYGQTVTRTYGRVDVEITKERKPTRVNITVVCKAAFPCEDSSWVQSLKHKLGEYVRTNRMIKKGTYVVSVQFVVDKDGVISDVKSMTVNGYGMEEEVMRTLKKSPTWLPASQGVPVRPYRT